MVFMSINSIPKEIKGVIVGFVQPTEITPKEIQNCGRVLAALSSANKELNSLCKQRLNELKNLYEHKRTDELVAKYHALDIQAKNPFCRSLYEEGKNPHQLLDALSTGCKYRKPYSQDHTFTEYTHEIENDIKDMVRLIPQSMKCTIGALVYRTFIHPLAMACFNENIPISIIELLLKNGANPKTTYYYHSGFSYEPIPIHVLNDLKNMRLGLMHKLGSLVGERLENKSKVVLRFEERLKAIAQLFLEYGVDYRKI
jgi:hypothetical protein